MEDKRITSGDFDTKIKTDRSDYPKFFAHGLVLSIAMAIIGPLLPTASSMLNSGFEYLTIFINSPPASTPSPMITGIFLVDFTVIGLLIMVWVFGSLNLSLIEKIWKKPQNRSWERRLGTGTLLLVCLLTYHVVAYALLHLDLLGMTISIILTLIVFPMINGVIGLNVTTLQLD